MSRLCLDLLKKALDTFTQSEANSTEAQELALRYVRMALLSPNKYTFLEFSASAPISSLSDSHPKWSQLIDIFVEQDLEDYIDFLDEHEGFLEEENLDGEKLEEKMRLLTFASLAAHAASGTREIKYKEISKALQIPFEEVELWSINAINANLCQGKLSQQRQEFLVHSATYRVFSEKQWRELLTRINATKSMLLNVISTLDKGEKEVAAQQKRELEDIDRKLAAAGISGSGENRGGGGGGGGGSGSRRRDQQKRQDNSN